METTNSKAAAKSFLPLKRFLVPIDFSPRSRLAVQYAGGLAKKAGASVELLFVVEPVPFYSGLEYTPLTIDDAQLTQTAGVRLRKLAATLLPGGVAAAVAVKRGKAAEVITDHARDQGVDLIILPTHGYSGMERVLMGSTAERIVRHAPCAVLTLRLEASAGGVRRGIKSAPQLKRILAPVDFSGSSGNALRVAADLARRFQSRMTALHVTFSVPPPTRLAAFARRQDGKAVEEARGQVAAFVREQLGEAPELATEVVAGLPQDEIARVAARLKADLIVIATHGRTGLKRWLMGSTAEQVIRHAPCPVLVVRQRQARPSANRPAARPQAQSRQRKLAAGRPASRSALPRRNPLGWPRLKEGKFV